MLNDYLSGRDDPFYANRQYPPFPYVPNTTYSSEGSRTTTSVAVTARSHSQQNSRATGALPSMTNASMTECTSGRDSTTRSSRASIGQPYLLNVEDDLAVARPVQRVIEFECPFNFLGCRDRFYDAEAWIAHTEIHFQGRPPPTRAICCFCNMVFDNPNPNICWGHRMNHVALHHLRGDRLSRCEPDYALMRHIYELGLMQSSEYQVRTTTERASVYGEGELVFGHQPVQLIPGGGRQLDYVIHTGRRERRDRRRQ